MNDQQLDDLKQFIDSRISQTEARFDDKLDELDEKMLDGFAGVAEAIEALDEQIDKRLTKLERQTV